MEAVTRTLCFTWILLVLAPRTSGETYFTNCGGTFYTSRGIITSPGYPGLYPDYATCFWYITVPENVVISLRFTTLHLEYDSNIPPICYDYVLVYDGDTDNSPLIQKLCNQTSSEIISGTFRTSHNKMMVKFYSDINVQENGFLARFWTQDCPEFMYGETECNNACQCSIENTRHCDSFNGSCFCKPGWTGPSCSQDVDECDDSTACPINSECFNELGSFWCECFPGFQNVSGICEAKSCPQCSHLCAVNKTTGKEQCYCFQDKELGQDGSSCFASLYPHGPATKDKEISVAGKKQFSGLPVSDPIQFNSDIPAGKDAISAAHVLYNGVIILDYGSEIPDQGYQYIGHKNSRGHLWHNSVDSIDKVYYQLYESCNSSVFSENAYKTTSSQFGKKVMERASRDIEYFYNIPGFIVDKTLVATWTEFQPRNCSRKDTNTFQIVLVSGRRNPSTKHGKIDEEVSFVFFIYKEGSNVCTSAQPITVGISTSKVNSFQTMSPSTQTTSMTAIKTDNKGILVFELGEKLDGNQLCQRYVCEHSHLIFNANFQSEVNQLYQCPCSLDKSNLLWKEIYLAENKNTRRCFCISALAKRRLLRHNPRNIVCCYSWKKPKSNSTEDQLKAMQASTFIPSAYYLMNDPLQETFEQNRPQLFKNKNIAAKTWCCQFSQPRFCERFHKVFHNLSCTTTPAFFPASAFGDPSILTLDGLSYPMNGIGEYILMNAENFTLQARTGRIYVNGSLSAGSVFTAFAAQESDYARFQVQLAETNTTMIILAQGMDFTTKFYSDVNFDLSDDSISIRRLNENNKVVVAATFPCGVSLKVRVGETSLEVDFEVMKTLQNATRGLLGNFNNDPHDDFMLPNGTTLPRNITERQIYFNFARNYRVTKADSAFVYNKGESTDDYQDLEFIPLFLDETNPAKLIEAKSFCGSNNTACLYDYMAVGANFARNTRQTKRDVDVKIQKLVNKPPAVQLLTGLAKNKNWLVTEGQKNILQFQANDEDGDLVSFELVEHVPGLVMYQNGTLSYTPTLNPVSIEVRAKDLKDAYSPVLQIVIAVCPLCNNRGRCNTDNNDELWMGNFNTLKCTCLPAYTGTSCETELDACSLHPCAEEQNCTDLSAAQQGNSPIGYVCGPCPSGMENLYGSCYDVDECLNKKLCDQECQNTDRSYLCYCRPGFRLSPENKKTCIDINECEEKTSTCEQQSVNTRGRYKCSCYDGYQLADDGFGCTINENASEVCQHCQQVCRDSDNLVTCDCYIGFKVDNENGSSCVDIDECSSGAKSPCSQKCVNTVGGFNCSCYPGYKLDTDAVTCVECESGKYGENCSSTCNCLGRGVCDKVRGCVCDPSWTGTNCDKDVNECANSSACPNGLVCQNEPGSFRCICQDGYKLENGICYDINECTEESSESNRCDLKLEICENTVGNYSCRCKEGFARNRNSGICKDINECEQHIDGCEHICENGPGSYRCVCHQGYRLAVDRHKCEKYKNVCSLTCSHGCSLDENGQSVCICPRGYRKDETNSCQDIDECETPETNMCSGGGVCKNSPGKYSCECTPGNRLENDGRTCAACSGGTWGFECNRSCSCGKGTIRCDQVTGCVCKPGYTGNQCLEKVKTAVSCEPSCQTHEECVVEDAFSVCQCKAGFEWRSGTCNDKDECLNVRHHNCDQICTNTIGSYQCDCYSGYVFNSSAHTCQDINECETGDNCSQICTNTAGGYRCSCGLGQFLLTDSVSCESCINGSCMSCTCHENNTVSCNTTTGQCVCQTGWTSDDCSVDADECLTNPCPGNKECLNQVGSFQCKDKNISKSSSGVTKLEIFFLYFNIFLSCRISYFF